MFYVGQKVECVDISPNRWGDTPTWLTIGCVYTVSRIVPNGLDICEAPCPNGFSGYHDWRFRPIKERKIDISVFTKMLTPVKEKEPA